MFSPVKTPGREPLRNEKMQAPYRVPVTNSLLAAMPSEDYQLLLVHLQAVTLNFGEVIYPAGEPIRHVYFPTDSLASLLTLVAGHQDLEVGMVGHEGMLGVPLTLGVNHSPVLARVQRAGTALRITSAHFLRAFEKSELIRKAIYHYTFELMGQLTQAAACNRFHRVEARLASRLLMTRDRVRSNRFHLTQDLLANMLGVRRVGVTKAAGNLRERKLISYSRGEINILDSKGLEDAACQCYQRV
jgi:CRP-like cAMP-binding protein